VTSSRLSAKQRRAAAGVIDEVKRGETTQDARMAVPPRNRHFSPKASCALEFLANRPTGVTEALLLARGFSRRMLLGLVRQGLATSRIRGVWPGGRCRSRRQGGRAGGEDFLLAMSCTNCVGTPLRAPRWLPACGAATISPHTAPALASSTQREVGALPAQLAAAQHHAR
jgi:hypothetical protein